MATDQDTQFGAHSIEEFSDVQELVKLDFEEQWGDPLETENSQLSEVPERALIDFGNGETKDCEMSYFIKRAMLDEDATVLPHGEN